MNRETEMKDGLYERKRCVWDGEEGTVLSRDRKLSSKKVDMKGEDIRGD